MKKTLSMISIFLICISLLCGCGANTAAEPETVPEENVSAPAETAEPTAESDTDGATEDEEMLARYAAALEKYDADAVVMTVNGENILWSEYFSWLYNIACQLEFNYAVTDWDTAIPELEGYLEDPSFGAYVKSYTETNAVESVLIEQKGRELNAGLTAEQQQSLDDDVASYIEANGEDAFDEYLSSVFVTRDYFARQSALSFIYQNLHDVIFGANGENLPEEDALNYLEDQGYLHAKNILFSTVNDEGQALDDASIAEKRETAQRVLDELRAVSAEELPAKFDELMAEYSEDPGAVSFPDGYYFQSGEMVASFEEAASGLAVNELSGLVESDYGIHIVYHPAPDADDLMDYDSNYVAYTPRAFASDALFNEMIYDWFDEAEIAYTDEFADFSVAALLNQ